LPRRDRDPAVGAIDRARHHRRLWAVAQSDLSRHDLDLCRDRLRLRSILGVPAAPSGAGRTPNRGDPARGNLSRAPFRRGLSAISPGGAALALAGVLTCSSACWREIKLRKYDAEPTCRMKRRDVDASLRAVPGLGP